MPLTVKRSKKEVLKEAEEERQTVTKFTKRQSKFIEHTMRADGLEYLITIEGKRD